MLSCRMSASFSRQLRLLCPGQLSVRSCCLAAYPPSSRLRGGPDTKVVLPHSWLTSSGPAVSPQLLTHSWLLLPSSGQMRNFSSSSLRFRHDGPIAKNWKSRWCNERFHIRPHLNFLQRYKKIYSLELSKSWILNLSSNPSFWQVRILKIYFAIEKKFWKV